MVKSLVVRWFGVSVLLCGELVGCAPQPLPRELRQSQADRSELIPYRALTREDFKGTEASGLTRAEEEQVQAMICTEIVVRPRDVVTRATYSAAGSKVFVASIDDPIFFAAMSRRCSWWRPGGVLSDEQVLEHEQIHFAIAELEARRLNVRAADIARRVYSEGTDLAVSGRAQSELRSIINDANQASIDRSTVFDIQSRDRVRQRQWFHKVMGELDATRAFARGPQNAFHTETAVAAAPAPAPAALPNPTTATPAEAAPAVAAPPMPARPAAVPQPAVPAAAPPAAAPAPNAPSASDSSASFPD